LGKTAFNSTSNKGEKKSVSILSNQKSFDFSKIEKLSKII
jgi:hypothetical protein